MPLKIADTIDADVLVIGGGGAGLRAAIEARRRGAQVLLVSKSPVGYANNTAIALGGLAAATGQGDPDDGPEAHLRDTIIGGRFINDQGLVEVMARGGRHLVDDLAALGVQFAERGGAILYGRPSGHTYPRTAMVRADKGLGLTRPLRQQALALGVRMQEGVLITRLVSSGGAAAGAIGLDDKGNLFPYRAKATVLATGGAGQIYERHDNAKGIAGDGYALAYDVGLPLGDMEFVQFERTATVEPGESPLMLLFEALALGVGGVLRNSLGEDILEKYGISGPIRSTRDAVSRAIMMEVKEGRGIDGAVVYDLAQVPQERLERLYPVLDKRVSRRIASGERRLRALPVTHFFMGGVLVGRNCATALEGLYCAGEVVAGVHGANRLGSNALTEAFVFGAIAGGQAAEYARGVKAAALTSQASLERERIGAALGAPGGGDVDSLRGALKRMMWRRCGVLRDGPGLEEGLEELNGIERELKATRVEVGPGLLHLLETGYMVTTAEMVLRAALLRTESRGAHFREDYPEEDNRRWLQNIAIVKGSRGMGLSLKPVELARVTPDVER